MSSKVKSDGDMAEFSKVSTIKLKLVGGGILCADYYHIPPDMTVFNKIRNSMI
jgi:hypothetical protein